MGNVRMARFLNGMKKKLMVLSGLVVAFAPMLVFAAQDSLCKGITTVGNLFELLCKAQQVLNAIVPFAVALGVIYLIWGVVTYVIASEEEAKKKGRDRIIYGIIGLAVIISVWGLVRILTSTLNLSSNTVIPVPCVPGAEC